MTNGMTMKRTARAAIALALTLIYTVPAATDERNGGAAPEVEQSLRAAFPGTRIDRILPSEFEGIFELHMGENVAYGTPRGRYLLVGHIYDTASGRDVTQARIDAHTARADWSALPLDAAIRHGTPGGVKVAVFTDPDCPYCRKLAAMMPKIEGVEWYELLYPLAELHPNAPAKSRAILCAEDPSSALRAAMQGTRWKDEAPTTTCASAGSALRRIEETGGKLGVTGTPTLVREDGVVLQGIRDQAELQAWARAGGNLVTTSNREGKP